MPLEIERKYLVKHDHWNQLPKPQGNFYRQGYILNDPTKTVRVRATEQEGFITIKGTTDNPAIKPEYEYKIPRTEAIELLDGFTVNNIEKVRYKIEHQGKIWEIDVFDGTNHGLIVAEIELNDVDEVFEIPSWIDREVTHEVKYFNAKLSVYPFKDWE
jgi:CYTH domain-containing protein